MEREVVYVDGWRMTRAEDFDKSKHAGCGELFKASLNPKTLAEMQNEFAKGDYYGFIIAKDSHPFRKSDGFKIWLAADFNLETETRYAIKQGVCDTIEDCKLFVDQILWRDLRFSLYWSLRNESEQRRIAGDCVICGKAQLQVN